jgi:hypothetical protein
MQEITSPCPEKAFCSYKIRANKAFGSRLSAVGGPVVRQSGGWIDTLELILWTSSVKRQLAKVAMNIMGDTV